MLLSGTDNHIAGLGQMASWGPDSAPWKPRPGYEGYLNFKVAALPEILQDAGYYTAMSGKWHLGLTPDRAPQARGFDRSFALLPGGANHYAYEPRHPDGRPVFSHWASLYYEDDRRVDSREFPNDYYSSDYFTTRLIEFLEEQKSGPKRDAPFFAYLAFTAPHWPLQAPPASVRKYKGFYDQGPDVLRQSRLENQIRLGLMPATTESHPVVASTKDWPEMNLEERQWSAKTMEVFAGMVDRLDWNVGRLRRYLEATKELDNTFILFMSDNGAEGTIIEALPMTGDVVKKSIDGHYNNAIDNLGNGDSFTFYGPRWAQAATAPSAMYKSFVTEGGIRCPAIVRYPDLLNEALKANMASARPEGRISSAFTTVMDILPTILAIASVPAPRETFRNRSVVPVKGKSWVPHLSSPSLSEPVHDETTVIGWELFFHQAVRKGRYKAVFIPAPKGSGEWELFDLESDMGEIHNLADRLPDKLEELVRGWVSYVAEFGVFL